MGFFKFGKNYSEKDYKANASKYKNKFLNMQADDTYGFACQVHAGAISPKISNVYPISADDSELKRIDKNIDKILEDIEKLPKSAKAAFKYFQFLDIMMAARSRGVLDKSDDEIERTKDIFKSEIEIASEYDAIKKLQYDMKKIEEKADLADDIEFKKLDIEYTFLEVQLKSAQANVNTLVGVYNALIKTQIEKADGKVLERAIKAIKIEEYATLVEENDRKFEEYEMKMESIAEYSKKADIRRAAQSGMDFSGGLEAKMRANQEVKDFEVKNDAAKAKQYQSSLSQKIGRI